LIAARIEPTIALSLFTISLRSLSRCRSGARGLRQALGSTGRDGLFGARFSVPVFVIVIR